MVCVRAAASRTFCTAGTKRAMRMAMIAMTTSSSISVKPWRREDIGKPFHEGKKKEIKAGRPLLIWRNNEILIKQMRGKHYAGTAQLLCSIITCLTDTIYCDHSNDALIRSLRIRTKTSPKD